MRSTFHLALMTRAVGAVAVAAARADIYTLTHTGTVYNAFDQTGEFGVTGGLAGAAFKAVFYI